MMKCKYYVMVFLLLLTNCINAAESLDKIAAVVNNQLITSSELDARVAIAQKQLTQQNIKLPPIDAFRHQVLQMMIDQSLQLQMAARMAVTVSNAEFQQALSSMAASRNMTVDQLFQALAADGLSKDSFLTDFHNQLVIQALQQQVVGSQIQIKEGEIDNYLKTYADQKANRQYHLEDILVALPDAPTPDQIAAAQAKAQTIVQQLNKGTDFKTLAVELSNNQQALSGGDLGWRSLAELPAVFANTITTMQQGAIAGPIRAPNGFHIIRLAGIRSGKGATTTAKLRDQVGQMLFRRMFEQKLEAWIEQIRATAYIKTYN